MTRLRVAAVLCLFAVSAWADEPFNIEGLSDYCDVVVKATHPGIQVTLDCPRTLTPKDIGGTLYLTRCNKSPTKYCVPITDTAGVLK